MKKNLFYPDMPYFPKEVKGLPPLTWCPHDNLAELRPLAWSFPAKGTDPQAQQWLMYKEGRKQHKGGATYFSDGIINFLKNRPIDTKTPAAKVTGVVTYKNTSKHPLACM